MPLLEIKGVTRRFGDLVAVDGVSLAIEAGEFFTLLGPSGCGKTTLLRMIAGFDEPDQGALFLDGRPLAGIPPEKRPVHTVFQSYALFPHMTVAGNIAFPLEMAGKPREEIARRVAETLALVHLEEKGEAYPHELSGGQKQRVALARGLVNRPRLLLLDEPLGALDAKLREEMQVELINLQRDVGVTFVFVTHAQQEALALSHRIAVMNRGRVEQLDTPERLYTAPASRFVADFIGKINLVDVEVTGNAHGRAGLRSPALGDLAAEPGNGAMPGERGVLALRPELVRVAARGETVDLRNRFPGTVRELLYLGDVTLYKVQLEAGPVIEALLANSAPGRARLFKAGDAVTVAWRHDAGVFLRG
ncbi:MAG: ABC transporter ATP-binding protein [Burkholderiales bacterium]|nr:ABC transporter ATP-binding protein [Burkholderiales bacterium]